MAQVTYMLIGDEVKMFDRDTQHASAWVESKPYNTQRSGHSQIVQQMQTFSEGIGGAKGPIYANQRCSQVACKCTVRVKALQYLEIWM